MGKNQKRVESFKAAKQISAYVIMKGAEKVGIINAHFGSGYTGITCSVDAWNFKASEGEIFMQGKTHGGGYDLFTAAIDGMEFNGVRIYDHSTQNEQTKAWLTEYDALRAKNPTQGQLNAFFDDAHAHGFQFANWQETNGYTSCYFHSGLKRLEAMGYAVIQAI